MDHNRKGVQGAIAAIGMMLLIFNSKLAAEGAQAGIELCIKTVIPSLFPFFLLSIILTNALDIPDSYLMRAVTTKLGIPRAAAPIVIPAVLGGYPVGAKCIYDLFKRKQISAKEAERLLAFCSNAGPSFLFGMVAVFFSQKRTVWFLWAIHILSAALTAAIIPKTNNENSFSVPQKIENKKDAVSAAAAAMVSVCCWVILFRVILIFLDQWFFCFFPAWLKVLIVGMLELTNGCCLLSLISDAKLRFILCGCMLSFGGMCVLFQTKSVIHELPISSYVTGKLIQTVFSFLLSCAVVSDIGYLFASIAVVLYIILRKNKISIAISGPLLYNIKRFYRRRCVCCFEKK